MANIIKITTAAITGIAAVSSAISYSGNEKFMDGEIGYYPLTIDLDEAFYAPDGLAPSATSPINIQSIEFTCDVDTTKLPEYKAFLTQGILSYEDKNNDSASRTFCDCVSPDDVATYQTVAGKKHVQTVYRIGSNNNPLNMYIDDSNTMVLEFTWCTATSLSISDLKFTDGSGHSYTMNGELYSVIIESEDVTKDASYYIPASGVYRPFGDEDFSVTSTYGEYRGDYDYHWGIDICSQGSYNVYATVGGYVEYCDWENPWDYYQGFGQYVKIVGDDGNWYYYGHLSELNTSVGEYVTAGQQIGVEGTTGSSTGNHLHYEIRTPDGGTINPCDILGIPNEYGMVYVSSEITPEITEVTTNAVPSANEDSDLIRKCISFNKYFEVGSMKANCMNLNDSGAASIGIIQYRGELARELVSAIRRNNPDAYDAIVNKYPGFIGIDADWSSFTMTEGDVNCECLTELLIQDWAVDTQWQFTYNFMKKAIESATEYGITDPNSIMLYTRCYVNAGCNSDAVHWMESNPNASYDEIFNNISITSKDKVERVFYDNSWELISIEDIK